MAKGNMLLGYARGKVGSLVFKRQNGQQVSVPYNPSPRNARTRAQMEQRSQLSNLVAFYRAGIALLNHAFTSRPSNRSSYNEFVSKNLNAVNIYLTKEMTQAGGCVVAPYQISDGTLPAIQISGQGVNAVTNIAVGQLAIGAETTIGELSAALVANNANIEYGMQLSYISAVQSTDPASGYPVVSFGLYEITLSDSSELVSDYLPEQSYNVVGGFLAHGALVADGGFAWILSKKDENGKLVASPQKMIVTSQNLYQAYSGNAAATRAVASYNAASDSFLTPGENVSSGTSSAVQVSSAQFAGATLVNGSNSYSLGNSGTQNTIFLSGSNMSAIDGAEIIIKAVNNDGSNEVSTQVEIAAVNATDSSVSLTFVVPDELASKYMTGIDITMQPSGSFVWTGSHGDALDPLG